MLCLISWWEPHEMVSKNVEGTNVLLSYGKIPRTLKQEVCKNKYLHNFTSNWVWILFWHFERCRRIVYIVAKARVSVNLLLLCQWKLFLIRNKENENHSLYLLQLIKNYYQTDTSPDLFNLFSLSVLLYIFLTYRIPILLQGKVTDSH